MDPEKPTVIDPKSFPEPPATPIVITEPPKYGELTVNPNGTLTYTSNFEDKKSTTVDEAAFQYTTLSGATVVVRKQFILAQEGDIPSIIQTGYASQSNGSIGYLLLLLFGVTAFVTRRFSGKGQS